MPSNRADKMRNAAAEEAQRSAMRYRHGAVIAKGGKIIAQGHNHVRTGFSGPLTAHQAITLPAYSCECPANPATPPTQSHFSMHAEMHAISSALRGARPNVGRAPTTNDIALPHDQARADFPVSSRCGDAPLQSKHYCSRELIEGAKREQTRVAYAAPSEWGLKPPSKEGAEEAPSCASSASRCIQTMQPVCWNAGGEALAGGAACAAC